MLVEVLLHKVAELDQAERNFFTIGEAGCFRLEQERWRKKKVIALLVQVDDNHCRHRGDGGDEEFGTGRAPEQSKISAINTNCSDSGELVRATSEAPREKAALPCFWNWKLQDRLAARINIFDKRESLIGHARVEEASCGCQRLPFPDRGQPQFHFGALGA